jgi:hypothetical protein
MDFSLQQLEKAISLRKHIHQLEAQLSTLFGSAKRTSRNRSGNKRKMSAATRAKLSAAGKARWAHRNGAPQKGKPAKKGGLTPAGRRKLSQMMKARWAAKRKSAGKK